MKMNCIVAETPEFQVGVRTAGGHLGYHARTLKAGTTIFMEDEVADKMYQLVSGVVRLSKSLPDGRRQVLGFLFADDFFAPSGFATSTNHYATCTAEAVTEIQVIGLPLRKLDELMSDRPKFVSDLLVASGDILVRAQQQMLLLGRMSATERVAWFLLTMKEQEDHDYDQSIYLPMSRLDIADYLGIRSETVTRSLGWLRDHRLITVSSHTTITITDVARIHQVADGSYRSSGSPCPVSDARWIGASRR